MRERRARGAPPARCPSIRQEAAAIAPFRPQEPREKPPLPDHRRRVANPAMDRTFRDSPYALDNDSKAADAARDEPSDCQRAPQTGLVFEHYAWAKKKNLKWNSNPAGI